MIIVTAEKLRNVCVLLLFWICFNENIAKQTITKYGVKGNGNIKAEDEC